MSLPCTGSILIPDASQTSMHSLMSLWTMRRDGFGFAASPNVQPSTALIPENAAFMSSLLQRVPRKFSSTSTGPIFSSRAFTSAKWFPLPLNVLPSENVRLSGELVSSHTPGPSIVAPQATVHPSTRSSPTISAICGSGRPF